MRVILGATILVLAACLQLSWFGHVRPFGVMPNLVLVTVVAFSLWANASSGLAAALGGGLLLDIASGSDFGLRLAFFIVVALTVVAAKQLGLQADSFVAVVGITVASSLLYDLAVLTALRAPLAASSAVSVIVGALLVGVLAALLLVLRALVEGRRRPLQPSRELWQ